MRKMLTIMTGVVCVVLGYNTFVSAGNVFRSDWQLPPAVNPKQEQTRLVLITQELETPFWDQVGSGALEQARMDGASLEVWGSYGKNQEDFLKQIEIAIASKVDGIIVQGLDTDEFKNLTKLKAAFYSIPIITVANDVPMVESLRRTYVGSNQYEAGQMIARQLLEDMGPEGTVVLMSDSHEEYYQEQRLQGIQDVLKAYPDIRTEYAQTPETRAHVIAATQDVLNRFPNTDAFIAVNAKLAGAMIQEIGRRSQVEPYYIYSFDDGPESSSLLKERKLDGVIGQAPEEMGRMGVALLMQWLSGETVPLDTDGYYTDIQLLKATDEP